MYREIQHLAIYSTRNKIRQIKILDVLKMLYQQCKYKERTVLTKEVIKNYFLAFNTLFFRWAISCGKPVIAPLWHQVVFQSLIKQCTVAIEIHVQGIVGNNNRKVWG